MTAKSQRSLTLRCTLIDSPVGAMLIAATDNGLRHVSLGDDDDGLLADLQRTHPEINLIIDHAGLHQWADAVSNNLCGRLPRAEVPIDVPATDFQLRVWLEMRTIPYGDTRTYIDLARALGRPDSVRAVANACASNQLAVVIPCHRVVRDDGHLGGYRWGNERKRDLLDFERRQRGGAGIRDGGQMVLGF